jgi:peptide/nickel transport system substrate-binding protein
MLLLTLAISFVAVPQAFATDLTELVIDTIGEPMDLDPAWSYDTASAELLMNVYSTLLWFNRTNMDSYVPKLATSWVGEIISETSPEGLSWVNRWTFEIRTGVYFHTDGVNDIPGEGALLTPADIEYSFERILLTDCSTGPAWMIFEPLMGGYYMGHVNSTVEALNPGGPYTGMDPHGYGIWHVLCDDLIDHAVESNSTHVWFNLVMTYEPWLQIVAQQWGSILNQAWCVGLGDWTGAIDDSWINYWDPITSPLYSADPSAPGLNLDAALGTGPYMLDYWNKGVGNAWSLVQNPNYYEGWATPMNPPEWGTAPTGGWIQGHVQRLTSNYIPEWATRRLRFLGGVSDFCAVPREFMGQVLGQPGVEVDFPLPQLSCSATFFTYLVDSSSTRMGVMQANGTFNEFGAPPNMFNDSDTRRGFAHLFDFDTYLYASFLDEAISPVTPVVPGLSYYDPGIGVAEQPAIPTTKEYGITDETPGQVAYDLDLAVSYLQSAWGGALWANGFTIDLVYNEGNTARQTAAQLVQDGLEEINTLYGTAFHTNIVSIPWSIYKLEWRGRTLPYFIVGWLADYPDAHNFAHPFMHSTGAFSRWQGFLDPVTEFPNAYCDGLIESGINAIGPARQPIYTTIQQYYVDQCPGWVLAQATGRHWQRDWVPLDADDGFGWYYNPIYPGEYAYDLWKAYAQTPENVDVGITSVSATTSILIGQPLGDNPVMTPCPVIDVDVARLDVNTNAAFVLCRVAVELSNDTEALIVGIDDVTLGIGDSDTVTFTALEQGDEVLLSPGLYNVTAYILVSSGFAVDTNSANDMMAGSTNVTGEFWLRADVNADGFVELSDFFVAASAFATQPGHEDWDERADVNDDDFVELSDFFIIAVSFGAIYC